MSQDRAGRTYLSEFTARGTSLKVGSIHRAKSNEQLARSYWKSRQPKLSFGFFTQSIKKAKSTQDLRKDDRRSLKFTASTVETSDPTIRLEFERELEEHLQSLLRRECYSDVTVHSSVKFSVTGDRLPQFLVTDCSGAMSRPRSPKGKGPQQLEGLNQLLESIRHQLNQLSDERMQMEQRMDDVVNGIQQAHIQYQNQIRNIYQNRKRGSKHSPPTPGSLRRVHSSDERCTYSTKLIPRTSDTSLNLPDGSPSPSQKNRQLSFDESTPTFGEEAVDDSAYGGSCSMYKGHRNDSSSSTDSRSHSSSLNIGGSLSQSNDVFGSWLSPPNTIPELPESPRLMGAMATSSLSQDSFMQQSMPSLHYPSQTTPTRHSNLVSPAYRPHRSYSTSTPKNYSIKTASNTSIPEATRLEPSIKATSSPDVSKRGVFSKHDHIHHNYHHHHLRVSQRSSLSENVMNSVIAEDKVDSQSFSDSLSQLSTCTDDGSPKATGSTIIVRRSSLTGQLEHVRKPRSAAAVKRNSSFDVSKQHSTKLDIARERASSMCVMNQTLPKEFKVLNRGVRCRRKKRSIILNTSVETTV